MEQEETPPKAPPSPAYRALSVVVFAYAVATALGLMSFDTADIASLDSTAGDGGACANWAGAGGAYNSWALLRLAGLAAYLAPPFCLAAAAAMARGRRVGRRAAWALLFILCVSGLLQSTAGFINPLLDGGRLGIAPNPGGGLGWLIADKALGVWLGASGAAAALALALLAALVMLIGPGVIAEYFFTLRARGLEAERQVEEAVDAALAQGGDPAEARRRAKEENKQRKAAEKAALAEARAREREKKHGMREAEKARRLAEREAKKIAREQALAGRDETDEIYAAPKRAAGKTAPDADAEAAQASAQPAAERRAAQKEPPEAAAAPAFAAGGVDFALPKTQMLAPVPQVSADDGAQEEIAENIRVIQETLAEFGIEVEVTGVTRGPVITCYEVKPPPGVKIDRISSYSNDLQMKLKAISLRILSPIPGKSVMGIEIPNRKRRAVALREIAERPEWKAAAKNQALPMLLGMDVSGGPVIADLAKMPHILVAGATGSGKSVCLNSILAGFLLSRTPEEVRLLMVDPKMVEFTPYSDLPHLVVPIITAPKKVAAALQWSIVEMKRRLSVFKRVGVRNIASFNARDRAKQALIFDGADDEAPAAIPDRLPYIVIVIDEMADLMMMAQKEVEPRVASLAQLSRAVGIHMILATQRPSVNVITGLIKANFPARVAFKVSQRVDSQTILDTKGAEHLIGSGDMLFNNPSGMLVRAQGAWISDAEVADLVGWYKKQGAPVYVEEIKSKLDKIVIRPPKDEFGDDDDGGGAAQEEDPADADSKLLRQALEVIVNTQRASTSGLQRQLRLGYTRAARIMDELEKRGCIGPPVGPGGNREILRTTLDGGGSFDETAE